MVLLMPLLSHLFSIIITLSLIISVVALVVGVPYCKYTFFVSKANTNNGIENLAKYLAKKSSIEHTHADDLWKTFIPAARRLGKEHTAQREVFSYDLNKQ